MEFKVYNVLLRGVIWQGTKGQTTLQFLHEPSEAEIKDKAGDFRYLTSATVEKKTTAYEVVKRYRFGGKRAA